MLAVSDSTLPQPHMWYSANDAIDALKLFIDAGEDLGGSLTYRYSISKFSMLVFVIISFLFLKKFMFF